MGPMLLFTKTLKGTQEIESRKFNLPTDLRSVLILVDGRRTVAQLNKQLSKMGNIPSLLETLQQQGFIEPQGAGATSPPSIKSSAASHPSPPTGHTDKIKAELELQIKQHFGLMANSLINKLEKYNTLDELYGYAIHCRELIQESFNKRKADTFWDDIKGIFPPNK